MDDALDARAGSLRLSLLEFSRALSSRGTVRGSIVGHLAGLQTEMRSLGDVIQASCEVSALARLPIELQVRILSKCSARSLCRLMATAHEFRMLVERVEPAAAEAQYAAAASLRPPTRTPLMRLRWLEDAAEYARNWSTHYQHHLDAASDARTSFPRYAGGDVEAGGFLLAVARFKLETPPQQPTPPASPRWSRADEPPERPRVLDRMHPDADADFVSCVRVALIVIDPELAEGWDVPGQGAPTRRADALTWLGELLSRDDLSDANRAYAMDKAAELVQPVEMGRRTALRGSSTGLDLDALPLLRGLWLSSRRIHGVAAASTVRRGLTYASLLDRSCRESFSSFMKGEGASGEGATRERTFEESGTRSAFEEARAERVRVLRDVLAAQQVDRATWPAPHRFLTSCALTEYIMGVFHYVSSSGALMTCMLPGSELEETAQLFDEEYALICPWLATAQEVRSSWHSVDEMSELYGAALGRLRRNSSLHQRVRSKARDLLRLFSDAARKLAGKEGCSPSAREFQLAEGLLRRKLRLLQRHKQAMAGDAEEEEGEEEVGNLAEVSSCEMQLAKLLTKGDSVVQLIEARALMQRYTCVWRNRVSTACTVLVESRRQYLSEHQIDENDVATWPLPDFRSMTRTPIDELRQMSRLAGHSDGSPWQLYRDEVQLVHVLCRLLAVSRRLAELGAVDGCHVALDRDEAEEATRVLTHELITRYHTLAVGDGFVFQKLRMEMGHEAERGELAHLRTTVAELVGMEELRLGAEAMQRARVEAHAASVGVAHDHTLHSRWLLALLFLAHDRLDAGCDCLREIVDAYGTHGSIWKLSTWHSSERDSSPSVSLRDESAFLATELLHKALVDAGRGEEAQELRRKRNAEMLALTADSRDHAFERLIALMRNGETADAELVARRTLQAARQRLEAARAEAETQAAAAEAQAVAGQPAAEAQAAEERGNREQKERLAVLEVATWACHLADLLSRSEGGSVLAEAEQLAREALEIQQSRRVQQDDPPLFGNDHEVMILARLLAKQHRFDEARLLLRGQLGRCCASTAHALRVSLFWLLLAHAGELRAEVEIEDEQADEDDAAAQTALSLKWSVRNDRLAQAAQLMLDLMSKPGEKEATFMSVLSGAFVTMSHADCAQSLQLVRNLQAADAEYWGEDREEEGEASGNAARAAGEASGDVATEAVTIAPSQLNDGHDAGSEGEGAPAKRQRSAN